MKPWLPRRSFRSRTTHAYLQSLKENGQPRPAGLFGIESEAKPEPEPASQTKPGPGPRGTRTRTRHLIMPRIAEIFAQIEERKKREQREILESMARLDGRKARTGAKGLDKIHRSDPQEWIRSWARGPIHRERKGAFHKADEKTDKSKEYENTKTRETEGIQKATNKSEKGIKKAGETKKTVEETQESESEITKAPGDTNKAGKDRKNTQDEDSRVNEVCGPAPADEGNSSGPQGQWVRMSLLLLCFMAVLVLLSLFGVGKH
jgi:cobalamin biosynthesis Mg chelatase CobN